MPNFPGSFDNDGSLYVAVNNLRTSLTAPVSDSDLVIPVLSTSGFPDSGFVTLIGNPLDVTNPEAVTYSGIDTVNFYATQRGADGTVAKAFNTGATAGLNVVADHHNQLKDAVIELEYYVGISGSENFLRQDDVGNVSVLGDLTGGIANFQEVSSVSGTFTGLLTISGEPVLVGDQVQYPRVDGTRGFEAPVSGVSPTQNYHLTTRSYVDGAIDTDIATHAADSSAHHIRYSRAENDAILGFDGITVTSGINTISLTSFYSEAVTFSGSLQSQIDTISSALPIRDDLSFTTAVVDREGGEREINQAFNTRSLVRKLKITPTAAVDAYIIQFFTKDTFSFDDLLEYEATASGTFVDNFLWFHEDEDGTGEIHLKLTNNSLVDSTFQVEMKTEKFE